MTSITYFPIASDQDQLIDLISRAAWFLSFSSIDRIYVPIDSPGLADISWWVAPGMDPAIANNFDRLRTKVRFVVAKSVKDLDACMREAAIILRWKKDLVPSFVSPKTLASWEKGKKVWQVDPVAVRMEGSFYIEAGLYLLENKTKLIEENHEKFKMLVAKLGKFERVYLMATGPSIGQYKKFAYEGALTIVCNSVILDEELMNTVRPQILVFADPIFHFGPSQYAASFRAKLRESAQKHDYTICIPFKYYGLFVSAVPELAERTIGIPFVKDREFNFDLTSDFALKTTANILTFLMVPLGSTFANEIGFLGCDGRPLKENTYFWNHNPNTQFNDKMANIREVHPGFFNIDYNDYYREHCETLQNQCVAGERLGKEFFSLGFSHIPALKTRLGRGKRGSVVPASGPGATVLLIDPDAKTWAGHYMAYNEKLSAAIRALGANTHVVCRKDISPDILSGREHYIPVLSAHSWEVGNRIENKTYVDSFEKEVGSIVSTFASTHRKVVLYMYCGSVEHAKVLWEITKDYANVCTNINLFWLSFRLNPDWIQRWREFFELLDNGNSRFVATVPTAELRAELAELTGCILDVAPHPSTGVSDAQFLRNHKLQQRHQGNFVQVLFPSAPRPEKGYLASIECVRQLAGMPNIHSRLRHAPTETTAKELAKPLERMPDNARIIKGALEEDEFLRLFKDSDLVVLPYAPDSFAKRTSGLLIDAIYFGVPCVVVEGTWLANVVRHYGCGVIVADASAQQLVGAILEVASPSKHKEYRERAWAAGRDYFSKNSWEDLGCFILGIGKLRRVDAKLNSHHLSPRIISGPFRREQAAFGDETDVVARLFKEKGNESVMVDVGAHHGSALMPFLNKGWRIVAFEPDENNRKKLVERVERHANRDLVSVDSRAVSHENRQGVAFYRSEESTGISALSAFHPTHREAQRIDTVMLSDALADKGLSAVNFLKIDTEGHDLFVLKGFPWERFEPAVIECEFEDAKTVPLGYTFDDLAQFLVDKGYTVYVSEWHPVIRYGIRHDWNRLVRYPCTLADPKAWGNLLAFRDGIDEAKLVEAVQKVLKFGASQKVTEVPPVKAASTKLAPDNVMATKLKVSETPAQTAVSPIDYRSDPAPEAALDRGSNPPEYVAVRMDKPPHGTGWHLPEKNERGEYFCWTGPAEKATVNVHVRRNRERVVVIEYEGFVIEEQVTRLRIEVDGRSVPHTVRTEINPKCIVARVPARPVPTEDATELALVLSRTVSPSSVAADNPDGRLLGLCISSVYVIPAIPALHVKFPGSPLRSLKRRLGLDEKASAGDFPLSHFDGFAYLQAYPDVANAVRQGRILSAIDHYILHGYGERRRFTLAMNKPPNGGTFQELTEREFDGLAYLRAHPDVAEAVRRQHFSSALEHYIMFGRREGRPLPRAESGKATPGTLYELLEREFQIQLATRTQALKEQLEKAFAARQAPVQDKLGALEKSVGAMARTDSLNALRKEMQNGLSVAARSEEVVRLRKQAESLQAALAEVQHGVAVAARAEEVVRLREQAESLQAAFAQVQQGVSAAARAEEVVWLREQAESLRADLSEVQRGVSAAAQREQLGRLEQEAARNLESVQRELAALSALREAREQALGSHIDALKSGLRRLEREATDNLERIQIAAVAAARDVTEHIFGLQVDSLKAGIETAKARAEVAEVKVASVHRELGDETREIRVSLSALGNEVDAAKTDTERLHAEVTSVKTQSTADHARITNPNVGAFNPLHYQALPRMLTAANAERLSKHWAPLFGLEIQQKELFYLAHRICSLENLCQGRLAASVQDVLLRILVARASRSKRLEVLEVGTLFGLGIIAMHEALAPLSEGLQFTAIDPLDGYYGAENRDVLTGVPVTRSVFQENLRRAGVSKDRVTLIQMLSTDPRVLKQMGRKRYDVLVIDADHTYGGVKHDAEKFVGKVRLGGYLIFDDYGNPHWPDVKKFVDAEIMPRKDLELVGVEWHTAVFRVVRPAVAPLQG